MYIIVVGCGQVGYYLTRALLAEGHEVLVLERDGRTAERASEELEGGVVLRGDGCEATTLADAGTARADLFVAVTGEDEDNLVACQVAKKLFSVPRAIARINDPRNRTIFQKMGIDVAVSATELILEQIEAELPTHPMIHLLTLRRYGLEVLNLKMPSTSVALGVPLRDVPLPPNSLISLVVSPSRGAQIPSGETVLEDGDEVMVVTRSGQEAELRRVLIGGGEER